MFVRPRPRALDGVVEEATADVEDLEHSCRLQARGHRQRVVAGAGTNLEHALARHGLEDLEQSSAGDQRPRDVEDRPAEVRKRGWTKRRPDTQTKPGSSYGE
jgi:hypothetical protein